MAGSLDLRQDGFDLKQGGLDLSENNESGAERGDRTDSPDLEPSSVQCLRMTFQRSSMLHIQGKILK